MGRLRRWFGKEHNPKRAELVRRSIRWMVPADGITVAGALLWIKLSPVAGIPLIALGLFLIYMSIRAFFEALREPHWDSPRDGGAAGSMF